MEEIFGPEGLIARIHPEYEYRPGQVQMAAAVLRAFEEKRHLIVEAGTGTGKTLAYLVPAVAAALADGKRVIISTGTKNLQEQLMEKDIPFLQRALKKKFSAAYMKGRNNYACMQKVSKAEYAPILQGLDEVDHFEEVRHWMRETETGDRAELTELPEDLGFWRHIDARSERCLGQKCPDYEPCFITRMRQRATNAELIIVNHHLFFADLALRDNEFGQVLPDYGAVIFDEAHLIEDIASEYFGAQISSYQIDDVLRDVQNLPDLDDELKQELIRVVARVSRFADGFWNGFRALRADEGRFPLLPGTFGRKNRDGEIQTTPLGEGYLSLDGALKRLEAALDIVSDKTAEMESVIRRIREVSFDLEFIIAGDDKSFVYWMERRGRGCFLRASAIDVSNLLQDKLFDKVETVVLTSATLASGTGFEFIRNRLGLLNDKTDDLMAASSFDFKKQAITYLPPRMPDPRSAEWNQAAAGEIIKILNITEGRAFVLSTSFAGMRALYEAVSKRVEFPCLLQGSMSKAGLLERFRNTPNAVLFATASFWQGVDVRGEQLSCVIIDKLPFAVPSDPIVAARQRTIDERGGSSFYEYSVPQAVIALKQGVGRLIRSATDTGVIALLDPRLQTKGYGRVFLQSLPPCRVTKDLADVREMFSEERATAAG